MRVILFFPRIMRFIKVNKKISKVSFGKVPNAEELFALTGKGVHRSHEK